MTDDDKFKVEEVIARIEGDQFVPGQVVRLGNPFQTDTGTIARKSTNPHNYWVLRDSSMNIVEISENQIRALHDR